MDRPRNEKPASCSVAELADAQDLRSVIAAALAATPVDDHSLRRGVWTYVGAARHAGASPGQVIGTLTDLVNAAGNSQASVHQLRVRRVTRWCVEAYFGYLDDDVGDRDDHALADSPALASSQ